MAEKAAKNRHVKFSPTVWSLPQTLLSVCPPRSFCIASGKQMNKRHLPDSEACGLFTAEPRGESLHPQRKGGSAELCHMTRDLPHRTASDACDDIDARASVLHRALEDRSVVAEARCVIPGLWQASSSYRDSSPSLVWPQLDQGMALEPRLHLWPEHLSSSAMKAAPKPGRPQALC